MVNINTGVAFEQAMESAIALWQFQRPDEVADWEGFMAYQRECGEENGFWTQGRKFKHVGECPAFVHARIAEMTSNFNWFTDKKLRDTFFRRFTKFRMDQHHFGGTAQSSRAPA